MSRSRVVIALVAVVVAIIVQTTVFGAGRIQPLGVPPALVTLVVIAIAPYIEAEYHILVGFTAGILVDLTGSGTLGLWAMSLTIVAFVANRIGERFTTSIVVYLSAVFGLTVLGQVIYVLVGTLFGQGTLGEPQLVQKIVLPAVWNLVLAYPVWWLLKISFRTREKSWAP
ncbi:MAG: rod shape-determining protein MreD [Acidimicrobiia bacterium]